MEAVTILLDKPAEFDAAVHGGLKEGQDLHFISKDDATEDGKPAVVITFTVQLPDGALARAQCVTTAALIQSVGSALAGRYGHL